MVKSKRYRLLITADLMHVVTRETKQVTHEIDVQSRSRNGYPLPSARAATRGWLDSLGYPVLGYVKDCWRLTTYETEIVALDPEDAPTFKRPRVLGF